MDEHAHHGYISDKSKYLARLKRIEGQVRGIRQMIEDDRYCGDEINVANAVMSAVREVAVLIISQHLEAGIQYASAHPDQKDPIEELTMLLRAAMKL